MRPHLRYRGDVDGRRPSQLAVTHITEYVVRLALRERWDQADYSVNADRIRLMMFAQHSELIELAALSGLAFVGEDTADMEVVLSTSDIGYQRFIPIPTSLSLQFQEEDTSDFSFARPATLAGPSDNYHGTCQQSCVHAFSQQKLSSRHSPLEQNIQCCLLQALTNETGCRLQ